MNNFKQNVREFYKPFYANGDEAHLIDHADDVCELALEINREYSDKLVILASYIHDIFNAINRKKHHILAYEYVKNRSDAFLQELSDEELKLVAHAVLEHRASFKGKFFSKLSAIISSADRGLPDLNKIVIRSMLYNNANARDVYNHMVNKYGSKGYAKYPAIYQEIFTKELKEFKEEVDNISVKKIEDIWKNQKFLDKNALKEFANA